MRSTFVSVVVAVLLIGGAFMLTRGSGNTGPVIDAHNVSIVDGKQIINLTAKGGYTPIASLAKAGIPTILRLSTNGVFDCSSSFRIPSMNIARLLPNSGITDIDLGIPKVGTLQGTCGMGMYPFKVEFKL